MDYKIIDGKLYKQVDFQTTKKNLENHIHSIQSLLLNKQEELSGVQSEYDKLISNTPSTIRPQ